jgi:hypothetical protein
MSTNRVDFMITEEFTTAVATKLDELLALLTFLIDLTPEERIKTPKMGRKNLDFVVRSLELGELYPRFFASFNSLEELSKDVELFTWLRKFQTELAALLDKVDDTALMSESEAFQASRGIYANAKIAAKAGDEEAVEVARELSVHFKKLNPKKDEEPAPEPTSEPAAVTTTD